jgi:enamine deaminase RidA (YjgF/YER057c/UK114 family)
MTLARTHSWPEGHWDWPIHLSHKHGLRCGDMIFVGGQVDLDSSGNVRHAGDLATQTIEVMAYMGRVLEGFDADLADVVMLTAFYVNDGTVDEDAFIASIGTTLPLGATPAITAVALPYLAYEGMLVEIEATAMRGADGARLARDTASPDGLAPLPAPFVQGVRCGEMIFVSGQSARDATGAVVSPGDVLAQSEMLMENIGTVLAAFGADHNDSVRFRMYYAAGGTADQWEGAARVRASYFTEPGPAATGLPVEYLAPIGAMARMELIAMLGTDGERLPREHAWPEGHWDWPIHLPYKHGIKCGNMIYLGGQVSLTPEAEVIDPGDMPAQTHTAMANIVKVLDLLGANLDDVVKVGAFYAAGCGPEALHANLKIRSDSFTEPGPASTGIPLSYLAFVDMVVEFEIIAMAEPKETS